MVDTMDDLLNVTGVGRMLKIKYLPRGLEVSGAYFDKNRSGRCVVMAYRFFDEAEQNRCYIVGYGENEGVRVKYVGGVFLDMFGNSRNLGFLVGALEENFFTQGQIVDLVNFLAEKNKKTRQGSGFDCYDCWYSGA